MTIKERFESFEWLYPWIPLNDEIARTVFGAFVTSDESDVAMALSRELTRETATPSHPLCGIVFEPVAFCAIEIDDILFVSDESEFPIICVHLTWEKEGSPKWPRYEAFESISGWREQMLKEAVQGTDQRD